MKGNVRIPQFDSISYSRGKTTSEKNSNNLKSAKPFADYFDNDDEDEDLDERGASLWQATTREEQKKEDFDDEIDPLDAFM